MVDRGENSVNLHKRIPIIKMLFIVPIPILVTLENNWLIFHARCQPKLLKCSIVAIVFWTRTREHYVRIIKLQPPSVR